MTAIDQDVQPEVDEDAKYEQAIERFRTEIVDIATKTESLAWQHAVKVHYAIEELSRDFPSRPKNDHYIRLSRGHTWAPGTIKKAGNTIRKLFEMRLEEVAITPSSGFSQVADVLHSKLSNDDKESLLRRIYKHDKDQPDHPYTVEQVRGMIKELLPTDEENPAWLRATDFWEFDDCDPRFGHDGGIGRLPGQVFQNLIRRFGNGGGLRLVSAMCGTGTCLDVCAKDQNQVVAEYRGIDIYEHPGIRDDHGARFILGDVTQPDGWNHVCPPEWADMMIVTPPPHRHVASATTADKSNLGNVTDPDEYLSGLEVALSHAIHRTANNGVVAVVLRQMGSYQNGTPVPNAIRAVSEILEAQCNIFLASPVMRVAKMAPPGSDPEQDWVQPEVHHILVYRK